VLILLEFGYPIKKIGQNALQVATRLLKFGRAHSGLLITKPSVVSAFVLFGVEFGEH
jgi:hypothetical protein